jgi:hypothetical protein
MLLLEITYTNSVAVDGDTVLKDGKSRVHSNGVTGIFDRHYPSDRAMALELTKLITEVSTRNVSWGIKAVSAWG